MPQTTATTQPRQRGGTDHGRDYNAFGRDPDGLIAYLAALFYGPSYVPGHTVQQFVGRPEPPRFGPPAPYQFDCLPEGFVPRQSPFAIMFGAPPLESQFDIYAPPPHRFDPQIFSALMIRPSFRHLTRGEFNGMPFIHPVLTSENDTVGRMSRRALRRIAEGYETDEVDEDAEVERACARRAFPPR